MIEYEQIETYAESEDGLRELVNQLRQTFALLGEFSQQLKAPEMDGEHIAKIMRRSNGVWDELKIVFTALDTVKTNRELSYFQMKKDENERDDSSSKFNATATEKEARATTNDLRRVRNWVEAYLEVADKNIITGQSLLKKLEKREDRTYLGEGRQ